ncbi:NACHT domain- and WD repeat-containing protein 1 isoform X2 [Arctopsyche grandis]
MLHSEVTSKLRVWCRTRGWQLHVVDLHWRTPLEAQRDHEFPRLCLSELARHSEYAYVIPVLFLNSSLGTPLLPLTIECSDFRVAVDSADNEDDRLLLSQWYEVDSAASPPCYRLTERGNEDKGDEERRVLAVFQKVLSVELRDAYLTTVVEQEVHNTVLMSQELARRCLWINRVFMQQTGRPEHDSVSEKELQRRLAILQKDLKSQLVEKHIARAVVAGTGMDGVQPSIPEHAQYLSGAKAHLAERLKAAAEAIIEEHASRSPLTHAQGIHASMFEELNSHTVFCQKTAQSSVNREAVLNSVKNYIVSDSTQCLVIVGASGSGKSTLIARAAQCCHQWSPDAFLAFRFVGITNMASTVQNILSSVVNQSSIILCGSQYVGRYDIPKLCEAFQKIISEIAQQRPTIIMIDGLDQVQGFNSASLDWIPTKLPDNVKIVITVAEGHKEMCPQVGETLRAKLDDGCFINMPDLTKSEARSIVMTGVVQYNHSVNAAIQEAVLKLVGECNIPLHAKILAWRTSVWQAWGARAGGSGSAGGALAALEELCGESRLRACLGALTASRHGLADHEMVDLLAREKQFHSLDTYLPWAPAAIFWARASARLAPFFVWGGDGRARWRDRALTEAARECFFPQAEMQIRKKLVDYFEGKWYEEKDPNLIGRLIPQDNKITAECFNARKLEELPYQRYHLCKPNLELFAFEKFFIDDTWIFDKISALGCGQLLEDIGLLELADDDAPEHVRFLKEFLEINSFALNYDAKQFYTLMYLFLEEKSNNGGVQSEICQKWYNNAKHPPIPSLVPMNLAKPSTMGKNKKDIIISELFDTKTYDLVVRLEKCEGYVASLSTEREEICVWDLAKCKKVRTLQGVTHPINLVEIDQFRCVVLCRRELRVYDLNTGTFITSLKGVMNQKMPFYGLHDPSHLVCLSRNRMYVNLMNTDTGDCVTTFKAGEDRFLNSLLVSGDGRMLVCGDETQKPFPLLVWNLSSRKLLYDLRIPHHDFITSLAAITHEGSYVCVVALELDEPTPNFIVVYDLQSGTLFKKWKPGRDTASLAISSADGCVVSGLDDARILVWDLVTGNCRYTLWGHTGAVTCLRLAPNGGHLLSSDIRCRDRSIRLWDLHSGTLISVFTPPERVSSCEILSGGRHVALALESHKDLVTLTLMTNGSDADESNAEKCYGDPENEGKIFDLRDKELGNGC